MRMLREVAASPVLVVALTLLLSSSLHALYCIFLVRGKSSLEDFEGETTIGMKTGREIAESFHQPPVC